jgi:hypothetical protein
LATDCSACDHVSDEAELLRDWKNQRPQCADILLQRVTCYLHDLLLEPHTSNAIRIIFLDHSSIAIIALSRVRAHRVE